MAFPKGYAILQAIRNTGVGDNIILHNKDMSVWCILKVICKEHPESQDEDRGIITKEEK